MRSVGIRWLRRVLCTRRSSWRAVAVLALVLGVLSMHGLVMGDHGGRHDSAAASHPAAQQMPTRGAEPRMVHAVATVAGALPTGDGDDGLPLVAGLSLCLAVLLASLSWWRHATRRPYLAVRRRLRRMPAARTSPPGRGPPRLLLAQLCVLRT